MDDVLCLHAEEGEEDFLDEEEEEGEEWPEGGVMIRVNAFQTQRRPWSIE